MLKPWSPQHKKLGGFIAGKDAFETKTPTMAILILLVLSKASLPAPRPPSFFIAVEPPAVTKASTSRVLSEGEKRRSISHLI